MAKNAKTAPAGLKPRGIAGIAKNYGGWLFLIPSLLLFAFFIWEPMIYGIILSFSKMSINNPFQIASFNGIENYKFVLTHPHFADALLNTLKYTLWSLIIGFLVPVILAIMLNEMAHLQRFFKFVTYFPALVPAVASLLMWQFLLTPGDNGVINSLMTVFGLGPFQFLQNASFTIPILVITMTWKSAGATTMIYLASLQGINAELYEAAALDGAGLFYKLRYITVPGIYNTARLMLIMQVIAVFQILYEPMVMTGGGPSNASVSLMLLSYRFAFTNNQFHYAAVVGIIVTLILLLMTAVYMKFVREKEA